MTSEDGIKLAEAKAFARQLSTLSTEGDQMWLSRDWVRHIANDILERLPATSPEDDEAARRLMSAIFRDIPASIRLLPQSTISHPWRETLAVLSLAVYLTLAGYWLLTVAVPWLTSWLPTVPWTFGAVQG